MATSMHTLALSAIEAIEKATTPSEVHEAVQATIEQIGYANCVMVKMPERGESTQDNLIMNTRPAAFADIYFGEQFDKIDILLFHMRRARTPFTWQSVYKNCKEAKHKRIENIAKTYGMSDGLMLTIQQIGSLGVISFAGPDPINEPERHNAAQLVALYAYSRLNTMLYPPRPLDDPLHWRERECLSWVAAGKTDSEIADILGLSHHSVNVYIERAKTKLGASNRTAAVVAALRARELAL